MRAALEVRAGFSDQQPADSAFLLIHQNRCIRVAFVQGLHTNAFSRALINLLHTWTLIAMCRAPNFHQLAGVCSLALYSVAFSSPEGAALDRTG